MWFYGHHCSLIKEAVNLKVGKGNKTLQGKFHRITSHQLLEDLLFKPFYNGKLSSSSVKDCRKDEFEIG